MSEKYTKAKFMENIRTLTSPFEQQQREQGEGFLPKVAGGITEAIQRVIGKKPPEVG